jgi:hypothetical protein
MRDYTKLIYSVSICAFVLICGIILHHITQKNRYISCQMALLKATKIDHIVFSTIFLEPNKLSIKQNSANIILSIPKISYKKFIYE